MKKPRRSYRELFLDELGKLSGKEQKLISNASLRASLDWDEERYNRIKSELQRENSIIIGRGYGGAVGLADAPGSKALSLFVSYSHRDTDLKAKLMSHLFPLKQMNLVESWADHELKGGDKWEEEIAKKLEGADIILLLVSIDFINSKYCYENELGKALERHAQQQVKVIPIILRDCLWEHTSFAKLQALPKNAAPITTYPNIDQALTEVAKSIREIAESIRSSQ